MITVLPFLLAAIAWLSKVLLTSLVTFLCLWQAKRMFIFLRGFYMVSECKEEEGKQGLRTTERVLGYVGLAL